MSVNIFPLNFSSSVLLQGEAERDGGSGSEAMGSRLEGTGLRREGAGWRPWFGKEEEQAVGHGSEPRRNGLEGPVPNNGGAG